MEGQLDVANSIKRLVTNFNKDSASRKTEEYLKNRLSTLETLWADFQQRHKQIPVVKEHEYTKDNIFEQVSILYGQLKTAILDHLKQLQPGTSDNDDVSKGKSLPETGKYSSLLINHRLQMNALQQLLETMKQSSTQPTSNAIHTMMLKGINNHWDSLAQSHARLVEGVEVGDYDPAAYYDLEQDMMQVLLSCTDHQTATNAPVQVGPAVPANLRLPKIAIPTYSGDYLKWKQFEELFSEIIGKQQISGTQKLMYLLSNVSGEAKKLIQHLQITEHNFETAWETLRSRYDNKRLILSTLLDKLMGQPAIQHESTGSLRTLHDTTKECVNVLSNIGMPSEEWSSMLHHIILKKLDATSHAHYEQSLQNPREVQQLDQLLDFIELRFQALESLGPKTRSDRTQKPKTTLVAAASQSKLTCITCQLHHPLFKCSKFLMLSPAERLERVKATNRCINCLRDGHGRQSCPSRNCLKCGRNHHTLLHLTSATTAAQPRTSTQASPVTPSNTQQASTSANTLTVSNTIFTEHVFLATAVIKVLDQHGNPTKCRALLDSGSQVNFLTDRMAKKLGLKRQHTKTVLKGIGAAACSVQHRSNLTLQSITTGFSAMLEVFIIPKITSEQPSHKICINDWPIPKNVVLADPLFNINSSIDLLIGAELFSSLLAIGQIKLSDQLPTLQNTVFGWVVLGKASNNESKTAFCGITIEEGNLGTAIERFWEMEESYHDQKPLTPMEKRCEEHFQATTRRDSTGRYIVRLPFERETSLLGHSKELAIKRFHSLEARLNKHPQLKTEYHAFIDEYIQLNHMEEVKPDAADERYYIPHHCVLKPESTTTKLRVVFDASAKTSTNFSLNQILATGPTIQDDLFSLLTRFRLHRYVFTADISKMYRQIIIDEDDRKWQTIVWRFDDKEALKFYQLRTITYGTTAAPYLATRCLQKLADDEREDHPLASRVAKSDFYVDDVMTGSNNIFELMQTQSQLIHLLQLGGLTLHKWCSNLPQLLKYRPKKDVRDQLDIDFTPSEHTKTLGVTWIPATDKFIIKTTCNRHQKVTKRTVLSDTAHIFDPLGLVNPCIVLAKIFVQELWALKLDWDAALPMALHSKWLKYREDLQTLGDVEVPRHVVIISPTDIQIHAFSDASERAYGTAIYLRSTNNEGQHAVHLICAKSKVAPIKTTTLPRLELCAAKLMTQLTERVRLNFNIPPGKVTYWTDSQIVLSWIQTRSSLYHTFVANRIADIQQKTKPEQWKYVNTKLNPADLVSRGVPPYMLKNSKFWFNGPEYLQQPQENWPNDENPTLLPLPEVKRVVSVLTCNQGNTSLLSIIDHRNSLKHLLRITCYIRRFIQNCKKNKIASQLSLSVEELEEASSLLIRQAQNETFPNDLRDLKKGGETSINSKIRSLSPFLDKEGIIRVGGRLQASKLPYDTIHPILLCNKHLLTRLIMEDLHREHKHAGPQALLGLTRQRFWPTQGRKLAQTTVAKCILCSRYKPRLLSQVMGNLPPTRIQPAARPFCHVGIDFAGPIHIHYKLRGKRPTKAYMCVFVCFATKAVHLEVCSDLTTAAFIGCLKRFIARRGCPAKIYCDNATNFVGAKNELAELSALMDSEIHQDKVIKTCADKGIEWNFIPPRSPHFGGLWEAAVKSAKHYLRKILHTATLTYEELCTVVTEIEGILNSRPLTPLSNDPNDLQALTPGHFLIGEPMTSRIQDHSHQGSLTKTWSKLKVLRTEFWKRWSNEYLHQLQQRSKWTRETKNLATGTLVLVKEDNTPPLTWHMGRVTQVYTGPDGKIRVADVKTAQGIRTRAIHNLSPLPVESNGTTDLTADKKLTYKHDNAMIPEKPKSTKSTSIRPVSKLSLFLYGCLCITFGLTNAHPTSTPAKITPFNQNFGLYFHDMGKVSLTNDHWNIIVFFNLTNYWQEESTINWFIHKLDDLCAHHKQEPYALYCEVTLEHLHHQNTGIASKNKLIRSFQHPGKDRIKRGLFNGIGMAAKELFGSMDSRDAEHYEDLINSLKHNEDHLLGLIKNQTTIQDSTLNLITKDSDLLERQIKVLQKQVSEIKQGLNEDSIQGFLAIVIHTTIIITEYRELQDSMLEILLQTNVGKFHPSLITSDQLKAQLSIIRTEIPQNLMVTGEDTATQIPQLFASCTTTATITDINLIAKITIPLINRELMLLYKLIPIPIPRKNKFVLVTIKAEYMAVNLKRDQWYFLHMEEFKQCHKFTHLHHICTTQGQPFSTPGTQNESCELSLLQQTKHIPSTCHFVSIEPSQIWIPIPNSNDYIFVLDHEYDINIIYQNTVHYYNLTGFGLIQLEPRCILKSQNIELLTSKVWDTRIDSHLGYEKSMIINSRINLDATSQIQTSYNTTWDDYNQQTLAATLIREQLKQQHRNEVLPSTMNHHDVHHYSMLYSILGILIIIITCYCIQQKRVNYQPKAAPRTQLNLKLKEFKAGQDVQE